ncbi:MAG: twin-arginine translocase TatA/TatE family subunit [Prevotella sp.]|nr:twin-arginine translocase TatA/TatE family subunit [Prevotella sp.]
MAAQLLFIGTTELMLIAGIALLLFGGKKLPEMMKGLGQGVQSFKKGMNEPVPETEEPEDEDGVPTPNPSPTGEGSGYARKEP